MKKLLTVLLFVIAAWGAMYFGGLVPLLGSSISAILIGMIIRHSPLFGYLDQSINKFMSSYALKTGIVLLGFSLSMATIGEVGFKVVAILILIVFGSIGASLLANKYLKVNSKLALLIGIGTSICGGAAIVAASPIIEAEDEDIAVSITTMFIYSIIALLIMPILGKMLGYNDQLFGIFAGAAINDTASVVATAFEWSQEAGEFGTIVKLVRTLMIVPVTLGLISYKVKQESSTSENSGQKGINWSQVKSIIPKFVIYFLLAVIVATVVPIPKDVLSIVNKVSKILMTIGLVSVGLGVHIQQIIKAGVKPVLLGLASWTTVALITIIMIGILY